MGQGGAPVGTAFVEILPKTDGFVATLSGQLKAAVTQAAGGIDASPITKGLNTGLVALGGAALKGIYSGIKATQDWVAEVQTLQRVTGQSAEGASTLAATADAMGVSVTSLSGAMTVLSGKVNSNNAAFDKYGIATRDATGATLPMDQILTEIQAKYQSLPEGIDRTSFATSVFGRSGRALIPILGLNSDQMAEMADKAKSLGLVLSQDDVDAAQKLKIAQAELHDAFKGLSIQIGKVFIPILTALTKAATAVVEVFAKVPVPVKIAAIAFLGLNTAIIALRAGWGLLIKNFSGIVGGLQSAKDAVVAQTVATDENTVSTLNNVAANETSNATQIGTVESYNQAANALNTQTAAADLNTASTEANVVATGAMAGQTQLAGLAFGELAGEEAVATGFTQVLAASMDELWASVNAIKLNLAGFAVPLGWAALIIAAIAAITYIVVKNWSTIKRVTAEVWGGIVKAMKPVVAAFKAVATQIGASLGPVLQQVGQAFTDIWSAVVAAVEQAAAAIGPAIREIGGAINEVIVALGPFGVEIAKIALLALLASTFGPFIVGLKILAVLFQATAYEVRVMGDAFAFVFRYISVAVIGTINFFIDAINLLIETWNKLPFLSDVGLLNEVGQATQAAADATNNYASASAAAAAADQRRMLSADILGKTLDQLPGATDAISASFDKISGDIRVFSNASGVDLSTYKENLQKYIADPTSATVHDLRANLSGMKHDYNAWVDSIAQNFMDYGSVLDQFQNKNNVDLAKATQSLQNYANQVHRIGSDVQTIQKRFGGAARPLIQLIEQGGTAYLGLADAVAQGTKKQGQAFIDQFKNVKTQAQITADIMSKSLGTAFDKILRDFKIMFNQVVVALTHGVPPFKIDTSPAQTAVANLKQSLLNLPTSTVFNIKGTYTPPSNGPPHQTQTGGIIPRFATGGVITGAAGFIANHPTLLVGEGHYATPAGNGGEAVIPLNARGAEFIRKAWGGGDMKRPTLVMPEATDLTGTMRFADWRNGIATLDSEIGWEDAVRHR